MANAVAVLLSNVNATQTAIYCVNALSSIQGKLFDNISLVKYSDKFINSDLQFGFKRNNSTHVYNCTKEYDFILCHQ